ncbi:hypothetical protein ID866_3047 [Astraeus odoratus]|nr:hypothetical protein ID866_3047 [Astraeus odoratus]
MHHYPHIYLRRPVSRLLWFVIGAGVATWWHHSRAMHEYRAQYWPCLAHQQRRAALPDQAPTTDPIRGEGRWVWKANPSSDGTMGWNQQEWEENKERLKNMQKRVGEAMADMSESTLDSIVSAAEVLKAVGLLHVMS